MNISGRFSIELIPQSNDGEFDVSRMTISKQYTGELDGSSKGQMISHRSKTAGSAGYVAIERVTGKIDGKTGSFVLQHSGTMSEKGQQLSITVIPDSGEGELIGLEGVMMIDIKDGVHFYNFDYTLPD